LLQLAVASLWLIFYKQHMHNEYLKANKASDSETEWKGVCGV